MLIASEIKNCPKCSSQRITYGVEVCKWGARFEIQCIDCRFKVMRIEEEDTLKVWNDTK